MQTDKIPDEVMREAKELAWKCSSMELHEEAEEIARALMARDKRAAEIVASLSWQIDISPDHIRARKPGEYATAILTYGGRDDA